MRCIGFSNGGCFSSGRRELPFDMKQKRFGTTSTSTRRPTESPPSTLAPEGYSPYSMYTTVGFTTTTADPHLVSKVYESGEDFLIDDDDSDDDEDDDIDLHGTDDTDIEDENDDIEDLDDDGYSNEANITSKIKGNSTSNIISLFSKSSSDNEMKLEPKSLQANKLERLSAECTSEEMRIPCRLSQRWYCVIDNGRWRKHKCKTPATNLSRNFRKCACFTSSGLIYKKIPIVSTSPSSLCKVNSFFKDEEYHEKTYKI